MEGCALRFTFGAPRDEFPGISAPRKVITILAVIILAALQVKQIMAFPPQKTITKEQAAEVARKLVANLKPGTEFVILDDKTVEKDFGWVFFYTTKRYVETKDRKYLLPGNAPLVVDRKDGSTHFLSTSAPPARAIDEYEKVWKKSQNAK